MDHFRNAIRRSGAALLRSRSPLFLAAMLLSAPGLHGQNAKPSDSEVKAVYLYNFARFVRWPASAESSTTGSFSICLLGEDHFGPALEAVVAGEAIEGRAVMAKRISKLQEATTCRVLFISSSEESQLKEILTTLGKANVLTVSDIPQFSRRGGMVQFVMDGNRVRFEVNLANATAAGLTLSSELLKVAVNVIRDSQPGA
jgi:hypothetical protein